VRYTPIAPVPIAMAQDAGAKEETDEPPKVIKSTGTGMRGTPKQEDMCPFMACCCSNVSCYQKFPDCIGCYSQGVCTCIELELMMCKTGRNEDMGEDSLCLLCRGEAETLKPEVCCKMQEQMCCMNSAIAFPCDDEVPCMISILGLTMVKDYKFVCEFGKKMDAEVEVVSGNKA
jgi:hypothetical protein